MTTRKPPSELTLPVRDELDEMHRQVKDPQRIDGSMYLRIYDKILALFAGLNETVTNLVSTLTYTRTQIDEQQATQNTALSNAVDTLNAATWPTSKITSGVFEPNRGGTGTTNPYSNDLSSSTRRTAWVTEAGVLGYAPSSGGLKQDIRPAEITLEQLRTIEVCFYRYRTAVAIEETYVARPGYKAATEIGVIAEDLHDAGLWPFVVYNGRGTDAVPVGVHIELMGLAGVMAAQHAHRRLDDLERRINDLEVPHGDS